MTMFRLTKTNYTAVCQQRNSTTFTKVHLFQNKMVLDWKDNSVGFSFENTLSCVEELILI
jgi:hypothetical protein